MPEVKKTNSSVKSATATKAPVTEVKKSEVKELTEAIIKAEAKKETEKAPVKAVAAKKPAEKKTAAKKPATKKAAAPREEAVKVSIELQYSYKHISYDEIVQNSKNHYQYEMGGNVDEIKTLSVYVKPDEDAAYYVVNDKVQARIGL